MRNPNEEMAVMQERKRQLLHSARMHQLFREAERDRARLGERLLALVGDLMISGGRKLKAHSGARYSIETQQY